MIRVRQCWWLVVILLIVLAPLTRTASGPVTSKRVAFLVDSWYPRSHADVIGTRFLEGYRVGEKAYTSPLTIASVYTDAPRPDDQTRTLAARYGFRVAATIADALLEDPQSPRPRLAVDGVFIATREDLPNSGQPQSPKSRLQVIRDVLRIMDQTGTRTPIFVDKMLAASWSDAQAIATETARRSVPLMAGSVLPYIPLDPPLRPSGVEVGVVVASTPYWAFAFHAAELLQGFMEQRAPRESGVREIREVGPAYWSLPDRDRWGGRVFDTLLTSAKTRRAGGFGAPSGLDPETHVLLIQYQDGARAVLALVPRAFSDKEYLLGAQYNNGSMSISSLILRGEPFDHFGYLVHALVELFTTGHAPIPGERALLTTGVVLFGQQVRQSGSAVSPPTLAISYATPRTRP